ncbi:MAG: adenylate/guanylate cyclase domain-containing protein [Spirochaetaceae bacterium]|nr:MAG: adenylate/guanylate cyclase domain-containing protein [Spirochaetaceae bacterium]
MGKIKEMLFGRKIDGTRIVPIVIKIVMLFSVLLLVSNVFSNYINLVINQGQQMRLLKMLLVKDLREIYTFAGNQYTIYSIQGGYDESIKAIEAKGLSDFSGDDSFDNSLCLAIKPDGSLLFHVYKYEHIVAPHEDLAGITAEILTPVKGAEPKLEGTINFWFAGKNYFGVYKYNTNWDAWFLRAEELSDFNSASWTIFMIITAIIVLITAGTLILGIFLINHILRYIRVITKGVMHMQQRQQLDLMDLDKAPNDEITYMGLSMNALSFTIDNLLSIFRKFVTQDVADKAYREKEIRLEGESQDLTILFSDIRGFTRMTEVLGTDIITLLNLHYDKAISHIHDCNGIVNSIIGDALLAIFGAFAEVPVNKSVSSIRAAYALQDVASAMRVEMMKRRDELVKKRGALTAAEEEIYRAVLIDIGVGIDGGEVFYGNIGSTERMTNTVIGDNVNAASRLEGLTRIYRVPVICSRYVKDDVEKNTENFEFDFLHLDRIAVKGKKKHTDIYWPMLHATVDKALQKDILLFAQARDSYFKGDWKEAGKYFTKCKLPVTEVFITRMKSAQIKSGACPKDWDGTWKLESK